MGKEGLGTRTKNLTRNLVCTEGHLVTGDRASHRTKQIVQFEGLVGENDARGWGVGFEKLAFFQVIAFPRENPLFRVMSCARLKEPLTTSAEPVSSRRGKVWLPILPRMNKGC